MYETGTATDYRDLLERLHTFLTSQGSAFGLEFEGAGNGRLTAYRGGASSVAETWTATCWDASTPGSEQWEVVGSATGEVPGGATTGVAFSYPHLAFTITAGATAFAVGDKFTLSTAPPWISRRRIRGCTVVGSVATSGQYAAQNVLDGKTAWDDSRYWYAAASAGTLEFTFPEAITLVEYGIMGSGYYSPRTWTFEYWNGSAWVVLDTRSNETNWGTGEVRSYAIASPVSATRYRLSITASNQTNYIYVGAVQLRTEVGGVDRALSQYIWEGPGNDGASAILVGASAFYRPDVDYYDWRLCAFDGYGSAVPFFSQAGYHGRLYLPLVNSSIPYWFVASGRSVRVVAKVGTQYETAYLGFLEPYFTPEQLPYPMALGGSLAFGSTLPTWESAYFRYSSITARHVAFTHSDISGEGSSSEADVRRAQARVRGLDGVWHGYFARSNDALLTTGMQSVNGLIWPLFSGMTNVDRCADGSYALFPVVLSGPQPNHWGQFEGVAIVTGQDLTAETLITIGAVDWLAVPNINRTDRDDFLAMRLD